MITQNPFSNPDLSRQEILKHPLVHFNTQQYSSKSILYVFFTRHCGVGCPFCFFKSAPAKKAVTIADEFSDEGIDKYIEFANKANVGYLAISGGGEPLNHKNAVLRSIAEIKTDRIVMNTSGSWAMSERGAKRYIADMLDALDAREQPCKIVIRVSVSTGHSIKLGIKPPVNLIKIFQENYQNHPYLELELHSFRKDPSVDLILKEFPKSKLTQNHNKRITADQQVVKIMPGKASVTLHNGYSFSIGYTRIFNSGLRPDLSDHDACEKAGAVFMEDLDQSEDFFPAVVENTDGSKGIDWAINYNGNICPWTNQVNDNQYNMYEDDYETILNGTFSDPLMLVNIEKGTSYRDRIVAEADPRAVLRLRSISLRDYSGTVIFEEEKTRLYFTLRVLQDFLSEGRINQEAFQKLPKELQEAIKCSKKELLNAYKKASYTIIDQHKRTQFNASSWRDLLELIKLHHYELTPTQIQDAIDYYNTHTTGALIQSLSDIKHEKGDIERRLTERLMYMKPLGQHSKKQPQIGWV